MIDEQITKITVDLNKGGRKDRPDDGFVRGSAMVNGIPAEGDYVMASGNEWVRPKVIAASGAFDLGRVRPGDYTVSITRGSSGANLGAGAIATRSITVKAGESVFVDFNVRLSRLQGSVIDDANKPISGARIRVTPKGPSRGFGGGQRASSDSTGSSRSMSSPRALMWYRPPTRISCPPIPRSTWAPEAEMW